MDSPTFKDHFSRASEAYARFRPTYPASLFDALAEAAPSRALAWDCATGSGQAASALVERFDRVVATDASSAQIAAAAKHPNIEYRIEPAEDTSLPDRSVALVTVAQALHWFDHDAFYAEVRRVAAPNAIVAAWGYGLGSLDVPGRSEEITSLLIHFYAGAINAYWPPERVHLERRYESLPFPFERLSLPSFEMHTRWTLDALLGYLGTWSAVQRYREATGRDPREALQAQLERIWGDPAQAHPYRIPLYVLAGRISP